MKKMLSKVLVASVLALTAIVGLTGCSNEEDGVVLWTLMTGSDDVFWIAIVDAFNDTDPEMPIRNVQVPAFYERLMTVSTGGNERDLPDLITLHAERVPQFVDQGIIESMDDIISLEPGLSRDSFLPQAWDSGIVNGSVYSVPLDLHSSILYYNVDLLQRFAPHLLDAEVITFDDLFYVQAQIDAGGYDYITYPVSNTAWAASAWATMYGAQLFDGDLPTIDSEAMANGFRRWQSIVDGGLSHEYGDAPYQLFRAGQSVFIQEGTWFAGGLRELEDLNWGMTHTPVLNANTAPVNWTSQHALSVTPKERSPEVDAGIAAFLEFVRLNADMWAESGQNATSYVVIDSPEYQNMPQSFLTRNPESMVVFPFLNNGIMWDALHNMAGDIAWGRVDASERVTEGQQWIDDMIAERGE